MMTDKFQLIKEELRRRAKTLSLPTSYNAKAIVRQNDGIKVIPFLLGSETYALPFDCVERVVPLENYLPIPGTPEFILGITSISGHIYSVTNLKALFNLPPSGLTNLNKLIIVSGDHFHMGILADEVLSAVSIDEEDIGSIDSWSGTESRFLKGVTEERIILVDMDKLLNDPEMIVDTAKQT